MFLIFIGAIIGALFGSIPGAIIGGLIGYGAGIALKRSVVGGLRVVQSKLIDSTFSVMGALCKADKVVTRDEIQAVERAFDMFKLSGEQREQAKAAFTRGKQPGFDLDAAVDDFARISRGRGPSPVTGVSPATAPHPPGSAGRVRTWHARPAAIAGPAGPTPPRPPG